MNGENEDGNLTHASNTDHDHAPLSKRQRPLSPPAPALVGSRTSSRSKIDSKTASIPLAMGLSTTGYSDSHLTKIPVIFCSALSSSSGVASERQFRDTVDAHLRELGLHLTHLDVPGSFDVAPVAPSVSSSSSSSSSSLLVAAPPPPPASDAPLKASLLLDVNAERCALRASGTRGKDGLVSSVTVRVLSLPDAPPGWTKRTVVRTSGKSFCRVETVYAEPRQPASKAAKADVGRPAALPPALRTFRSKEEALDASRKAPPLPSLARRPSSAAAPTPAQKDGGAKSGSQAGAAAATKDGPPKRRHKRKAPTPAEPPAAPSSSSSSSVAAAAPPSPPPKGPVSRLRQVLSVVRGWASSNRVFSDGERMTSYDQLMMTILKELRESSHGGDAAAHATSWAARATLVDVEVFKNDVKGLLATPALTAVNDSIFRWFRCEEGDECCYKTRVNQDLKKHLKTAHNLG